jgi:hypothetical protein
MRLWADRATSARRLVVTSFCLLASATANAGPPYMTDDPEPVAYRHWELYLATEHVFTSAGATGTAPHVEVNYGADPNLQLHVIAPLAYARPRGGATAYGPGDVEVGAKLRFVQESTWVPMVGTFPLAELPVGSSARGLGNGQLRAFIPLWLQKSFGPWMTYAGGGYWFNPGAGNQNYGFVGWQAQRRLSKALTLGAEVFYTTADRIAGGQNFAFNVGGVLDLTEHHHVLLSAGRSIVGDTRFQGYLAYQLTL